MPFARRATPTTRCCRSTSCATPSGQLEFDQRLAARTLPNAILAGVVPLAFLVGLALGTLPDGISRRLRMIARHRASQSLLPLALSRHTGMLSFTQ